MEILIVSLTQLSKGAVLRHLTVADGFIEHAQASGKKVAEIGISYCGTAIWQMALKKNWKFWVPQLLF